MSDAENLTVDLQAMTGLEQMQAMIDGRMPPPPFGLLIGMRLIEARPGEVVFTCTPRIEHYNPLGSVHGGLAGTLLDSAMGCAVHTMIKPGESYTTLEYRVHLVRGMSVKTGLVRAEGKVVHLGRRVATAEGRIVDADGKLYAHGTTTCMILT